MAVRDVGSVGRAHAQGGGPTISRSSCFGRGDGCAFLLDTRDESPTLAHILTEADFESIGVWAGGAVMAAPEIWSGGTLGGAGWARTLPAAGKVKLMLPSSRIFETPRFAAAAA